MFIWSSRMYLELCSQPLHFEPRLFHYPVPDLQKGALGMDWNFSKRDPDKEGKIHQILGAAPHDIAALYSELMEVSELYPEKEPCPWSAVQPWSRPRYRSRWWRPALPGTCGALHCPKGRPRQRRLESAMWLEGCRRRLVLVWPRCRRSRPYTPSLYTPLWNTKRIFRSGAHLWITLLGYSTTYSFYKYTWYL